MLAKEGRIGFILNPSDLQITMTLEELAAELHEVKIYDDVILVSDFAFNLNIFDLNKGVHEGELRKVRAIEQVHGSAFALSK